MRLGNLYSTLLNTAKSVKGFGSIRTVFLAGILLFSVPAMAQVSFVNGSPQSLVVCQGSGATPINSYLTITTPTAGSYTWSISSSGSGSLSGFNYTNGTVAASTPTTPIGLTYTPSGSGTDAFTILVTGPGVGNTATTTINVTINPTPVVTTITPSVPTPPCQGSGAVVDVSGSLSNGTYTVSYTLTGGNTGSGTAPMTFSGGGGSFTTSALGNATSTTITLNSIAYTATGCSSALSSVSVSTTPSGLPATYTVGGGGTYCTGGSGVNVTLSNSVPGINYQLAYPTTSTPFGASQAGAFTGLIFGPVTGAGSYSIVATNATTGCQNLMSGTATVSINPAPSAITGTLNVCVGSTTTLSDPSGSGTWTSSNTSDATVTSSGGVVSGVGAGTPTISFTLTSTGCVVTTPVTVNALPVQYSVTITNGGHYCAGGSGVIIGVANSESGVSYQLVYAGTTNVGSPVSGSSGSPISFSPAETTAGSYSVVATNATTGCTDNMTGTVNVVIDPLPAAISGTLNVCVASTTNLTDATAGGVWSSSNTSLATIGSGSGIATGVSAGNPIITFTVISSGCYSTAILTVNPLPSPIGGTLTVCPGLTTTLTSSPTGGTWTSNSPSQATVGTSSGIVTGVSAGTPTITYTLPTGCIASAVVTVNPLPAAIGANVPVCVASTTTFTETSTGGSWSSNNTSLATIGSSSGIVTGVANGNPVISYTFPTGCYITTIATVNPLPSAIGGTPVVCVGLTTSVSDGTGGGSWTSGNTGVATIGSSSGTITGVSNGNANITYTLPTGCIATTIATVNPLPAGITGTTNVCVASTTTLSSTSTGGTWSSSNFTLATVGSSSGVVTGVSNGVPTITYTLPTGCITTTPVTVNPLPLPIDGTASVCVGLTTSLSDPIGGGTWTSSIPAAATIGSVSGVVTGVGPGSTLITYTLPTGCTATATVTVNPLPATIGTNTPVCVGSTITLTESSTGGAWSSGDITKATVGSGSGVVTGVSAGNPTITYTLPTGCINTTILTVNAVPAAITGTMSVCIGLTTTLADATTGGTWSSNNTGQATVGSTTGIVTGVASGNPSISYTLTTTGCAAIAVVTVNSLPTAITGSAVVCVGNSSTLSSTPSGGTWSSSNTGQATVSGTGVITGTGAGNPTITYTLPTGCIITTVATVNPLPVAIGGTPNVCTGFTTTLSDATTGGTWTSSNTALATINSGTGVVSGISSGVDNITYTLTATGCLITAPFTVNPTPPAITGTTNVCVGLQTPLFNTAGGGAWTSSNATYATVNSSTGVVTGVSSGTPTITYTMPTGCYITTPVTVNPLPGAISGTMSICPGTATSLADGTPGGSWSSSNTSEATVGTSGTVTGVAAGTPVITYTLPTGCIATAQVTVNPLPTTITGAATVCTGFTTTLGSTPSGGTWSSSNTSLATVAGGTGVVTGVASGTPTITYTLPTGCIVTTSVTVNPTPAAIGGTMTVCSGLTTTLTDATPTGTWSSSNTSQATVVGGTGVVTGVAAGMPVISYTLGTGCYALATITVNNTPAAISGLTAVCTGSTIGLSDATTGGSWSSSNITYATVASTGVVTGVATGNPTITYTMPTGCIAVYAITVNQTPAAITGTASVCTGLTTTLADAITGGTWSSSNTAEATVVSGTGVVTGVTAGTPTITYSSAAGCMATVMVTVNQTPVASTGSTSVCVGLTSTLSDATTGGTWTSSNTAQATVGSSTGIVTGVSTGTPFITYTMPTGCNIVIPITVNPTPAAISGTTLVCAGSSTTLSDATGGGTWSSGNTSVATVGASTGTVTGVGAGTCSIIYTLGAGCTATITYTVNAVPNISAYTSPSATSVCQGSGSVVTFNSSSLSSGTYSVNYSLSGANTATGNTATLTMGGTGTGTFTIPSSAILFTGSTTVTINSITNALGCASSLSGSNTATFNVYILPTVYSVTGGGGYCAGGTGVHVYLSGSVTGINYQLYLSGSPVGAPLAGASSGLDFGLQTAVGPYTVIATNTTTGCVSNMSGSVTVTINPLPTSSYTVTGGGAYCSGGSGVTVGLSNSDAGIDYQLYNGVTATGTPAVGSGSAISFGLQTAAGVYTVIATNTTTLCSSNMTGSATVTVNPLPSAVSGTMFVCIGSTTTLSDAGSGTWSSSNTAQATVVSGTGVVTGVAAGTPTITYTLPTGCLTSTVITVNSLPSAIAGPGTVCTGLAITLTDPTGGGSWSSSNTLLATAGISSGIITGVSAGTPIITYTLATGCIATMQITVNPSPAAITGVTNVCTGLTTTLSDASSGGVWSSSIATQATVGSSSGVVTGVATGTPVITYTLPAGCMATTPVTVNPTPASITGVTNVCAGLTTTLGDASGSGTWSSSNTSLATVGLTSGVVTGISAGTVTITYTLPAGCTAVTNVTVNPAPAAITGVSNVCVGLTTTLSNTVSGGTWTSSNGAVATVNSSLGIVTGVSAGTVTITYTLPAGCMSVYSVTVNPLPSAISGVTNVCIGLTTSLGDAATGGSWSSSNTSLATVNSTSGTVTGIATGVPNITYTLLTGCIATTPVTVNPLPSSITGITNVCVGLTVTLADASGGGSWTSGNTALATVASSTGVVTGVSSGNPVITYTLPTGCITTTAITVNPSPASITGSSNVCLGLTSTLADATSGGTWSSSNTSIATVGSTGIVTGVAIGTAIITYTLPAGCTTTLLVTVNLQPSGITGTFTVCSGQTTTLSNTIGGGAWSSSNTAVATVGSGTGVVTGISAGTVTITFTVPGGCITTANVTVNPTPVAISGTTNVCVGLTTILSDLSSGGVWSSPATGTASIGSTGIVTGVAAGTTTITYTLPAGCFAIAPFTVNPLPASITGTLNVCVGLTTTLSDASAGGSWSGSSSLVATVGSSSGVVTGVAAGTLTVTYTLPTGCINTATVIVNALPASHTVTGGGSYCSGGGGVDIGLNGSNTGISYQLMLGTATSGFPVTGTGSAIDFGNRTGSGTYTVVATNTTTSCTSNMAGNALVVINPLPATYNMTGGGGYCSGGSGVPVGLNGTVSGINYMLYYSGSTYVSTLSGTGGSANFSPNVFLSGAYTAVAVNPVTTCSIAMLGSATVTVNPLPTSFTVTGGGSYCAGGTGVHVGLSNSTSGVSYKLFNGGTLVSTLPGTGSSIDFGLVTGIGTYTVYDTNLTTTCTSSAYGSVAVTTNPVPATSSITGGGTYCSGGAGVHIGVLLSAVGVNYQLFYGTSAAGPLVTGTGTALDLGLQLTPTTATSVYTVVGSMALTGCTTTMTGTATVSINALPVQDTVTGGGSYCLGGTGVLIGVNSTQTSTNYILYGGASPISVSGTGGHVNFPLVTLAGTYTVVASSTVTTCTVNMLNTVVVNVNLPPNIYNVTGGGTYCSGATPSVHVGTSGSDLGVNYQLYLAGSIVGAPIAGTGSALDFGAQSASGNYTVIATNTATACASNMNGAATIAITTLPLAYPMTGGGSYCSGGTGVAIGLSNSATSGVSYQLYDGTVPVGSPVLGIGTPINFGLQTAGGIYTVVGTTTPTVTGCPNTMSGSVTVTILSLPAVFPVSGGGSYCAGSGGVPVNLGGSVTGYNYQVYNGTSVAGASVAGTGSALSLGLQTAPGRDSVVAINPTTGCKSTMTGIVTITVNPLPIVDTVTGGGGYCAGGIGVLVGLNNSTPGISYQLYNGSGATAGSAVAGTGSALSFGYHLAAGTRTAIATNTVTACSVAMYGSVSVSVNPLPTSTYIITGGGSYCAGGSGVNVGLSSSDAGVNYQLMIGSSVVGAAVPGTGVAISFGPQTSLGIYQVVGTNAATGCSSTMTGTETVSLSTPPTAYSVLGGGGYCLGTAGVAITLSNSNTGVNYQLYLGSAPIGSAVAGTGSGITFGSLTATGTYTVIATNATSGCTNNMTGSAIVSINTLPTAHNVTGGGGYCAGGTGVALGLNGSDAAISYQLMNGSAVGAALAGTGSSLSFGLQTLAGVYTVVATNVVTGCTNTMTGSASVDINPLPLVYSITGGGPYCSGGTGVPIGTSVSDMGINYQLYDGAIAVGGMVAGTGSPLDFGMMTVAGTYTAVATDAVSGCTSNLSGAAVVTINSLPTAYAITGGGSYCAGGAGLHVWLGGSNTGVNYQLYNGMAAAGSPVGGTGAVINFGAETAGGTYTVIATSPATGCSSNMTGSAVIVVNPLPFVDTISGGGGYCPGGSGVHIGLSNSTSGVDYQLMRGPFMVDFPVSGTGTDLDFGLQTVTGAYSVVATDSATGCSSNMSGTATVSISALPTAYTFTASSSSYCAGASGVDLSLSGSDFGTDYQLYLGGVATGPTVTGTGVMLDLGMHTTAGTYSVTATNPATGCTGNMTGTPSITINPLPVVYSVTGGGSYCAGGTGAHIFLGGSNTGVSYQLSNSGTPVGSAMLGTGYSLDFGAETTAGTYTVVASNSATGCSVDMLGSGAVAINPLPTVYTVSGGGAYCAGGPGAHIGLTSSDSGVNYQLFDGTVSVGSAMLGSTGTALDFGAFTTAGTYTVVATNSITTCSSNMTGTAVIAINATPVVYSVTGGGNYCVGGSGVHVGIAGSDAGINYQLWNGGTAIGAAMHSASGSSLDFGLQTAAGTYRVVATNATTGCSDTMAGSAVVTVSSLPNIYTVTGGGSYCASLTGADVQLSHADSGINYRLYNGATAVGTSIGGSGTVLDFGLQPAGVYTVVAINATTTCSSNMAGSATVTVIPTVTPTVNVTTGIGSDTVCAGSLVTFNAAPANGGPTPTYQWYVNGIAFGTGGPSYTYSPANGNVVSVVMTSDATCVFPATATGEVVMTVRANLTPSVSIMVSPKDTICQGSVVTFTADPVNGGSAPAYSWIVNGTPISSGPTYAYAPLNGDVVFCTLTSDYPCLSVNNVVSNTIHMTVDSSVAPVVTISNNSGASIAGVVYNDTLMATATPANPSDQYQWSVNGAVITGATSPTYIAASLQNDAAVSCVVTFTNACGLVSGTQTYIITALDNVGVKTVTTTVSDIKLLPNPNKGVFTIKGSLGSTTDEEVAIEITDMLGQVVYTQKVNAQNGVINQSVQLGSSVANGMYIVTLHTATENKVFHMVIEQ